MNTIEQTDEFKDWLEGLRDRKTRYRIVLRIERLEAGNPGQVNDVGEGISEMKIDYGPGYRVYYKRAGKTIYLLLCGGDKDSQDRDIKQALALAPK